MRFSIAAYSPALAGVGFPLFSSCDLPPVKWRAISGRGSIPLPEIKIYSAIKQLNPGSRYTLPP
jgi:hypothetical protein